MRRARGSTQQGWADVNHSVDIRSGLKVLLSADSRPSANPSYSVAVAQEIFERLGMNERMEVASRMQAIRLFQQYLRRSAAWTGIVFCHWRELEAAQRWSHNCWRVAALVGVELVSAPGRARMT
jgi:hypothetical protein